MSIHNTLATKGTMKRHRNVLTREERLLRLEEEGRWDESMSILGLPKVRNDMVKTGKGKKKKDEEEQDAPAATAP